MDRDKTYMKKCLDLASKAGKKGDFPIGSIIVLDNKIISKRYNEAFSKKEVSRHAEILALVDAQKKLSPEKLSRCTIYTSVEPCPMCSFAIQELNIRRVVFGLRSPVMGGYSRWKILQDKKINASFPNTFGQVPEIVPDILKNKIINGWKRWNKDKWKRLYKKRVFK